MAPARGIVQQNASKRILRRGATCCAPTLIKAHTNTVWHRVAKARTNSVHATRAVVIKRSARVGWGPQKNRQMRIVLGRGGACLPEMKRD